MKLPNPQHHSQAEDLLAALHRYVDAAELALAHEEMADLAGLDAVVDTLCARIIDLPRDEGQRFAPQLSAFRDRLDGFQERMRMQKEATEKELSELNARQKASRAYRKDKP